MKREGDFNDIAPIFEEFLKDYNSAKEKNIPPNEWLFDVLKNHSEHKTDAEIREFIADVEHISAEFDSVVKDAETSGKRFGWSAENWAYRKILDRLKNGDEDIDYWELFDSILRDSSRAAFDTTKKDAPDILLNSGKNQTVDNKKETVGEQKKEKADAEFSAQLKKTTNIHYQKAMKIDATNFDVRTNDMMDIANRLSKNVAMAGVGEMAITAGFAIASRAIKNRSLVGGGELAKILLKSGTDSAIRQVLIGSLKVGAEKHAFPLLGRMPSAFAITSIALITIQSVSVIRDCLKREIDVLTAVAKISRVTTATLLALGFSGVGMGIGVEFAQSVQVAEPILNTTLIYSASLTGGIIGNMVGAYFNKAGWKCLSLLKNNVKQLIGQIQDAEFNMNLALAPVYATTGGRFG